MTKEATDNNEKKAFFSALKDFQKEVPTIPRKREADMGKFKVKYADLADIVEIIEPFLSKHGLSYMQMPTSISGIPALKTLIAHEEGYTTYEVMQLPVNANATAQQIGAAITYMRRYALSSALGIVTEDDVDAGANRPPTPEKKKELWKVVTDVYKEANDGVAPTKHQMYDFILDISGKRAIDLYEDDVDRLIEDLK